MRIERLKLRNYRQFRQETLCFPRDSSTDMHLLIGENGTGKTNLLNAINWCLYEDEPHLSKNSQQLPILNLEAVGETQDGRQQEVVVELWVESDTPQYYMVFRRTASYRVYNCQKAMHQRTTFEVEVTDNHRGNTEILPEEEGTLYVNRFVPKRIREFFFFDGERLDQYFREATAMNIRNAVFGVSHLDLLDEVERKLDRVVRDLEKEAGELNPDIRRIREDLERENRGLEETRRQIEEKEKQASVANAKIKEYEEKLGGLPDLESLEEERKRLRAERDKKKERQDEKLRDKHRLLLKHGTLLMMWPAMKDAIRSIEQKKKKGEIPPRVDPRLLQTMLEEGICDICGQHLDGEAASKVESLLGELSVPSELARRLMDMEVPLRQQMEMIGQTEGKVQAVTEDIEALQEDLDSIERRLGEIEREIEGYGKNKLSIKEWHSERKKFEDIYRQTERELGALYEREKRAVESFEKTKRQFDAAVKRERKAQEIRDQRDFCIAALDVVRKTRQDIMAETRERIEEKTQELFFDLAWKRDTFRAVEIEPDYSINLIHSMGYECLGSVSAGERELLALSFTLALHDVSGFDSPILIDTPLARISGKHRENFGKVLARVSRDKQAILLLTPAEYSKDVEGAWVGAIGTRRSLRLSSNEKVSTVEEL